MRAISSRGDTATLSGGPTTLLGTSISASTLGGLARRSMIDTVSGAGSFCTTTLPSTSFTLLSLADTAICAETTPAAAIDIAPARRMHRHMLASPNFWQRNLSTGRAKQPRGELGSCPAWLPAPRAMTAPPLPCYELDRRATGVAFLCSRNGRRRRRPAEGRAQRRTRQRQHPRQHACGRPRPAPPPSSV